MVEFKPIPGYEGRYKINKQGTIIGPYGKVLRVYNEPYPKVYLYADGKKRKLMVHTLVMLTWVGPRPDGLVIRHLDGNILNSNLNNLTYGTYQENEADKLSHGRQNVGERCHNAVLCERKVKIARGLHKCGFTFTRIAEILQVKYSTAWNAIRGKTWIYV